MIFVNDSVFVIVFDDDSNTASHAIGMFVNVTSSPLYQRTRAVCVTWVQARQQRCHDDRSAADAAPSLSALVCNTSDRRRLEKYSAGKVTRYT